MKFKNLNQYRTGGADSNMKLGIPLPKTPVGRVYRYSPNENAHPRHFVLGNANRPASTEEHVRLRMKLEPGSNQTVCPYSGVIADDSDFTHPDDIEAAKELVKHAAIADVRDELSRAFQGLNRGQSRNSFIRIEAKVDTRHQPKPHFARRDLMRELECDHCGRDYGVFAIGLFCPDCGAPNLRLHFAREVELVSAQIDIAEGLDEQHQELAYRLLGNAHEDVLTAFEATLKAVYLYGMAQRPADAPAMKSVGNDFQNIARGKARFTEISLDPFDGLDESELELLGLNIQKRHVIGHNLGIMDEKFAAMAENAKVGETVHLVGADIRSFAEISQKVVDRLDAWLCGTASPMIGVQPPEASARTKAKPVEPNDDDTKLRNLDVNLSPLARQVGLFIARENEDGLASFVNEEKLLAEFAGADEREFNDAIAELETDGFIQAYHLLSGFPHIRPTVDLFATFDPIALNSDPATDALALIDGILNGTDSVDSSELHSASGWSLRRFNPALAYVLGQIDSRRISQELGSTYAASHFHLMAADRVSLKRILQRLN